MIVGDVDRTGLPGRATNHLANALSLRGDPCEPLTEAERCEVVAEVLGFGRLTMPSAWYLTAWVVRLDRL